MHVMRCAVDIGPALLPWRRSAAESYYGASREQIERVLADLSCGFWRAAGVTPPTPSAYGHALRRLGQAVHTMGVLCALSLLPFAGALIVLAVVDRSEAAIAALIATSLRRQGRCWCCPAWRCSIAPSSCLCGCRSISPRGLPRVARHAQAACWNGLVWRWVSASR
jgi:hypothetical protein